MNRIIFVIAAGLTLAACGSGSDVSADGANSSRDGANHGTDATYIVGDGSSTQETYRCPGTGTELRGTVFSPNGLDPIFGAVVYVTRDEPAPIASGVACDSCQIPANTHGFTTTGTDGTFQISHANDDGGAFNVVIQKGRFRRIVRLTNSDCAPIDLPAAQTALPGRSGVDVEMPHILVATGVNDEIRTVLTRIGITEFDTLDGCRSASTSPNIMSCPLGQLLSDPARLAAYNMVLLPCGALGGFHTWQVLPPEVATSLQGFLEAGGRLYASDLSYGILDHTAPASMSFAGNGLLSQNGNDPADVGIGGGRTTPRTYEGIIDDPDLSAWLQGRGALMSNGHIELTEFLNPWSAVDHAGVQARTWVHASVPWRTPTGAVVPEADHPLTLEAEYRGTDGAGCGRVVFTSYHTTSSDSGMLTPQERVLEWLLFELGGCVTPG